MAPPLAPAPLSRLARHLAGVLRPAAFHGVGQPPPFFEGWYFKLVDAEGTHPLVLIPGVHLGEPTAFLQVIDAQARAAWWVPYGVDRFEASSRALDVRVDRTRFTAEGLKVHVDHPGLSLHGELTFTPLTPWPVSVRRPGFMGWYAWAPGMECFHGVLSFDHRLGGALELNGRRLSFDGGRAYVEKDWGRNFPSSWVWLQSNHFGAQRVSVMGSIARVPWRGKWFPGFGAGIWREEGLETFATWNGARTLHLEVSAGRGVWSLSRGRRRLELEVTRGPAVSIRGPSPHGMDVEVHESLEARLSARLWEPRGAGRRVLFEGEGSPAGLEVQGDVESLRP